MRRLPLYFLIDVSESMAGEPIERVQDGLASIVRELRTDPYALETVFVSILIYAGKARRLSSLQELYNFYPPRLPIGSGTGLGNALYLLMDDMNKNIVRTTATQKGDWKPLVFLLTDGVPTDDYAPALYEWKTRFRSQANLVAIAFGSGADTRALHDLTDDVFIFNDADSATYAQFFRWISQSVKSASLSVNSGGGDGINLSKISEDVLKKVDFETIRQQRPVDDRYAVMAARCQRSQRPYLIKYQRTQRPGDDLLGDLNLNTREYRLVGSFPVDDVYFDLSDGHDTEATINTAELVGFPACPHCGNQYGFSLCGCGKLFCSGDESEATCPWCQTCMNMGFGEGDSNVGRSAG